MQELLENTVVAESGLIETDHQAEIHRLQGLIQEFLSKFQSALERDEHGQIIRNMVSAELSDIFNILDKKLLLHIAGISDGGANQPDNFVSYVEFTVGLRKDRQSNLSEELNGRELFSQAMSQAFELATILYPQNISETPREIEAREILLRLGLTILEQASPEDITNYFEGLLELMDEFIIITRYHGETTYALSNPTILSENKGSIIKIEKSLRELAVLLPIFQSYQEIILAINNSNLDENDKKALLFLLSSPYKQDVTNRDNWPNGFVRYYDENSEWLTKYLGSQSEQTLSDTQ